MCLKSLHKILYFLVFICPICCKCYKLRTSLQRHMRLECGKQKSFQCPYCLYASKQKSPVLRHVSLKHPESLEMYLKTYYTKKMSIKGTNIN